MRIHRHHPPPSPLFLWSRCLREWRYIPPFSLWFSYPVLSLFPPRVRGLTATSPSSLLASLLPHLMLAQLTTPSHPCSKRGRGLFAVGEHTSRGYSLFLHSFHHLERLPRQTHTRLLLVFIVIGSTSPPPRPASSRCSIPATIYSFSWYLTALTYLMINSTVAALGYAQSSYCTGSLADVNALGSFHNVLHRHLFSTPHAPLVLPSSLLL